MNYFDAYHVQTFLGKIPKILMFLSFLVNLGNFILSENLLVLKNCIEKVYIESGLEKSNYFSFNIKFVNFNNCFSFQRQF